MLFRPTIALLLATLAAAATSKRRSQHWVSLRVSLTNTGQAVTKKFDASMDGTEVAVNSTLTFDHASVDCIDICIPEHHCVLHDKNLTPAVTLGPGTTEIAAGIQVSQITCGSWLPGYGP